MVLKCLYGMGCSSGESDVVKSVMGHAGLYLSNAQKPVKSAVATTMMSQ